MEGGLVSAATGAMGSLLEKLATMLTDKYKLLKGVQDDIKFLKKELEVMQAFLLKMSRVEEPDEQAKLRANAVRDMSYDIEDTIDDFMLLVDEQSSSKAHGFDEFFQKCKKKIKDIKTRHQIAKVLKDLKNQIKEDSERHERYKIIESAPEPPNARVDPRVVAVYKDVSELVGIDGPRDELVKWLSNEECESAHQLKVVSIVGCGGLGKTTLAKQVYDKLGADFECRAFVSVSRSPDMTKILSSILSEISNGKEYARSTYLQIIDQIRDFLKDKRLAGFSTIIKDISPKTFVDHIRDFLKDKRYLIIIDDLWDVPIWRILECAFVKNSHGSRVMATTRKNDVAKLCCSSQGNFIYEMKPISESDSKKLFFKRIFDSEEKCPPHLKEASEDILKKCGGLPLAINAISSLLVTGKTKEEWERVRGSIGFAQGRNSDIDAMHYILSLSYYDLPLYLRSCLLYLTMFPEDYIIPRKRLVHRWISEGFIHREDGEDLVELGETYFHELINRSLIQPVVLNYDGKAWGCRVHDTVLDFLIYKATEEKFCTFLSSHSKPHSKIRRLSLLGNEVQGSVEQLDLSHARSLAIFDIVEQIPSLVKSNALRVLDLADCIRLNNHHIKDIGRLFQLRYLNVSRTNISELPRQIGDLVYLETLNASYTKLLELPGSVTRLKRLERLFVSQNTKLPDCIGNMEKLQDLGDDINIFQQTVKFVEELGKLINLRKLGVYLDYLDSDKASFEKCEMLVSSLSKLDTCKLHTLSIGFSLREEDARTLIARHQFFIPALNSIREITLCIGELCWITKWMLSLANLEKLTVDDQVIGQQEFDIVGSIPSLLEFTGPSCYKPVVISSSSGGFQRLQVFEFSLCVREFMFEAGAMPNVRKLSVSIILGEMESASDFADIGIHHLSSLAELEVVVYCWGVRVADVEAVEVAIKRMAEAHPNNPKLEMKRHDEYLMLKDNDESDEDNDESDDCPPPPPLNPPSAPAGAREKRSRGGIQQGAVAGTDPLIHEALDYAGAGKKLRF